MREGEGGLKNYPVLSTTNLSGNYCYIPTIPFIVGLLAATLHKDIAYLHALLSLTNGYNVDYKSCLSTMYRSYILSTLLRLSHTIRSNSPPPPLRISWAQTLALTPHTRFVYKEEGVDSWRTNIMAIIQNGVCLPFICVYKCFWGLCFLFYIWMLLAIVFAACVKQSSAVTSLVAYVSL